MNARQRSTTELTDALAALWDAELHRRRDVAALTTLSSNDQHALEYIVEAARAGATVSPKALAASLGISSASTTVLIDRLERRTLIRRSLSTLDRRALNLLPTPEGFALIDEVKGADTDFTDVLATMTDAERAAGIRFLDALTAAIRHRPTPRPSS